MVVKLNLHVLELAVCSLVAFEQDPSHTCYSCHLQSPDKVQNTMENLQASAENYHVTDFINHMPYARAGGRALTPIGLYSDWMEQVCN